MYTFTLQSFTKIKSTFKDPGLVAQHRELIGVDGVMILKGVEFGRGTPVPNLTSNRFKLH